MNHHLSKFSFYSPNSLHPVHLAHYFAIRIEIFSLFWETKPKVAWLSRLEAALVFGLFFSFTIFDLDFLPLHPTPLDDMMNDCSSTFQIAIVFIINFFVTFRSPILIVYHFCMFNPFILLLFEWISMLLSFIVSDWKLRDDYHCFWDALCFDYSESFLIFKSNSLGLNYFCLLCYFQNISPHLFSILSKNKWFFKFVHFFFGWIDHRCPSVMWIFLVEDPLLYAHSQVLNINFNSWSEALKFLFQLIGFYIPLFLILHYWPTISSFHLRSHWDLFTILVAKTALELKERAISYS
jgi:hypothetical protein